MHMLLQQDSHGAEQSQNRAAHVKARKPILSSLLKSCQLATSLDDRVAELHQPLIIVFEPYPDSLWHRSNMQAWTSSNQVFRQASCCMVASNIAYHKRLQTGVDGSCGGHMLC